ncbi:MAG TPA: DUF3179 domain-containing (seleno)protein [Ferruginibacter sp.]|nr:DUF3179 domain-containing (seleno)protein [Ferruginibacter sp.]
MKRTLLLITGLFILLATEILRVYFIMPFHGSQRSETIQVAYFISNYVWWFRVIGLMLFVPPMIYVLRNSKWWKKIFLLFFVALYILVFYAFNFKFLADKMFYQPKNKILASVATNKVDSTKLIIGININGQAKAYPIGIIGYHHQVQDTVGGQPVIVTYCTVCRTGRVFSPFVNGKLEKFRLVGMDHFNAMFEDATTKSWWRQVSGVAVAGPLKGSALKEIPSEQMRLGSWIRKYPNTTILQPDPLYAKQYKSLEGFDDGTIKSGLEKRDSGSWQFKSWVVGLQKDGHAKAYDWNELVKQRVINDTFQNMAVVLVLENDNSSFHVWNRKVDDVLPEFAFDAASQTMKDNVTGSVWNMDGECIEGVLKGSRLAAIQAYQEFWHSWESFHPATTRKL